MNQKIIKISDTHYIGIEKTRLANNGEYNFDGYKIIKVELDKPKLYGDGCHPITHSTQPLGFLQEEGITTANLKHDWGNVKPLSLSEVEEAIYGYSVEKMANTQWGNVHRTGVLGYIDGFKAHRELVKDKLFTIEDMKRAIETAQNSSYVETQIFSNRTSIKHNFKSDDIIQSLLPKTEWDCIIDEQGKIKLI